ncbi:Bacteriophytochrome [Flavobacterium limnosediminis JC2902]|uniref:histidine kinase n=1 Tax=Flavobacterium limnosediminis JC2902 TaxID=1341181 RepID=V6SQM7_9FLAO|nr:Bacteriophytochrome [Flavobacterium limnosediminis JC2902]
MLVDDLPQNLIALKSVLERADREIITCTSGNEALQILLKEKVSLILVDVQMPEMDGYEFVEIVKSHPATANIPTIFVTAISNDQSYITKAYDLGAIDFLFKPLNVEMTRKKVDSFLRIWDNDQELKLLNDKLTVKNQELEQFASILAHDLKAPLRNIKSLLEIIEDENAMNLKGEPSKLFEMVKASTVIMSRLIDDLLHYTRNIQNNEGTEKVNILATVENVIKLINPKSNTTIEKVNLDHFIMFQPMALNQIVLNLISNAIKYNDKDVADIVITFDSDKCSLSVKDNGPGIDEKYHTKVFEMFQTLGNKSNGESSTGIGLSLVKKLTERNNANIKINTIPDSGCEFLITNLVRATS